MDNEYSILIPVYNEENLLHKLLTNLREYYDNGNEIILINDGSSDNSDLILRDCNFINLITFEENRGKGCAIKAGLLKAKYDSIIVFDSDLEISPDQIKKLMILNKKEKSSFVLGYRFTHLNPVKSGFDWGNFIFTTFFNILHGSNHKDTLCCAKSFYKSDINTSMLSSIGFDIDVELTFILTLKNKNPRQVLMHYQRRDENEGKKLKISNGWEILFRIVKMIKYF